MLGQPISMLIPEVVGFKLTGRDEGRHDRHRPRAQGRPDAAQAGRRQQVRRILRPRPRPPAARRPRHHRQHGPRIRRHLRLLPDRRRNAPLPPQTGRDEARIALVEAYAKANGMWRGPDYDPVYTDTLELDMSTVVPAISGPKRPQDHTPLDQAAPAFYKVVAEYRGVDMSAAAKAMAAEGDRNAPEHRRPQGRPGRGRNLHPARRLGRDRLDHLLHQHLEPLRDDRRRPRGAQGPRARPHPQALGEDLARPRLPGRLRLSRGRGPAGGPRRHRLQPRGLRLHHLHRQLRSAPARNLQVDQRQRPDRGLRPLGQPQLRRPHLARTCAPTTSPPRRSSWPTRSRATSTSTSPKTPIGQDTERPRRLSSRTSGRSNKEIADLVHQTVTREAFQSKYADVFKGDDKWQGVKTTDSETYDWPATSTYIQNPPYFDGMARRRRQDHQHRRRARSSRIFGDMITTDHISPAGSFKDTTPAGKYLVERQVPVREFNSYGSRRGNHEVMMRGTFANIRIKNEMLDGVEGGYTIGPDGEQDLDLRRRHGLAGARARRWSSSPASNTAPAPRATGRPRARHSSASRPSSPKASSASTARTSSAWASSRSSSPAA